MTADDQLFLFAGSGLHEKQLTKNVKPGVAEPGGFPVGLAQVIPNSWTLIPVFCFGGGGTRQRSSRMGLYRYDLVSSLTG